MLPGHCLRSRQHRPAGDLYQPAHGNPRHGTGGVQGPAGGGGYTPAATRRCVRRKGSGWRRSWRQAAQRLDMAVMGPNCGGYVNLTDGICSFAFAAPMGGKAGGIGFFSQSGQLCINMLNCPELLFFLGGIGRQLPDCAAGGLSGIHGGGRKHSGDCHVPGGGKGSGPVYGLPAPGGGKAQAGGGAEDGPAAPRGVPRRHLTPGAWPAAMGYLTHCAGNMG